MLQATIGLNRTGFLIVRGLWFRLKTQLVIFYFIIMISVPEHYNKDQVKEIQKEFIHLIPSPIPLSFKSDLELWTKHKKDKYEENVLEDIMETIKNLGDDLESILSGDAEDHSEL